ncbi:MAG: class I SAM-dependent methyltransferase [Myxococcales bacterium]|nr:class I SAM-dependent methyltransferase [Myxococcales bacterium]
MYETDLARIHHEGFGDVARAAAAVLLAHLQGAGMNDGTVVDLGCGSGISAKILSEAGYDVLGIDLSAAMLEIAAAQAPLARFIRASILDTELPAAVAVTAIGEIFNYRFDDRAGPTAFTRTARRIFQALKPGGIFLFDVATPGRVVPNPREQFRETPDWSIYFRVAEDPATKTLTRDIVVFQRLDEFYRRSAERHELTLFSPVEIEAILHQVGFHSMMLTAYNDLTLGNGWIGFLARKPAR